MPADDVSDLRDVFDAINRLCDTMKTSHYDEVAEDAVEDDIEATSREEIVDRTPGHDDTVSTFEAEICQYETMFKKVVTKVREEICLDYYAVTSDANTPKETSVEEPTHDTTNVAYTDCIAEIVTPENTFRTIESYRSERWSDSLASLPVESGTCEPASEMYYTASSEVSLLSDVDVPIAQERTVEDCLEDKEDHDERRECVIAGHVAAMRERFESMTRTNTPCPDLMRSSSPSLDVFRNITPSPDLLG